VSRFADRSAGQEIMDDLNCAGPVVDQTLRELEIINRLLGGNGVTVNGVRQLLNRTIPRKEFSIADLGCGGGDMLKRVASWGARHKIILHLFGIDANSNIIEFAKKNTAAYSNIRYQAVDIFSNEFKQQKFDVITATLFTHHFSNDQLVELLGAIKKQAHIGIVINDIHRHWFAFYAIRILTRFLSKSAMVKFDAPLSVLRAFTRQDLEAILNRAGITSYSLHWRWAFRWQLIIRS
jgi:2-polyprenyl-3-methyl-5-hydroxy-6-metoxy-1,4-benzoquinol methylase